jgi:hypothetical protein
MSLDPIITYWEYDNFRAWRISKEGRKEGSCVDFIQKFMLVSEVRGFERKE